MPCCLGCLALIAPRLTIVLLVVFTGYIGAAFDTRLWPLLGFIFMPTTTLAYAWAINSHGALVGIHLAVFIVAVLIDLGIIGGNAKQGNRLRNTCRAS